MFRGHTILFTALLASLVLHQADKPTYTDTNYMNTSVIDGPYVMYKNDSVFVNYIENSGGVKMVRTDSMPSSSGGNATLIVNTGEAGKTFSVSLKPKLSNEKAEYNGVKKMLVISDIEGNFTALRKLLKANGVIDENFNWTFNKDHVVFTGDFVQMGSNGDGSIVAYLFASKRRPKPPVVMSIIFWAIMRS